MTPCTASAKIVSHLGIAIQSCVVNSKDGGLTNGINIVYYNAHKSSATEVDFLVRYQGHEYTLIDHGTFARGAQINHNLTNALVGQSWQSPLVDLCKASRVLLENGKVVE